MNRDVVKQMKFCSKITVEMAKLLSSVFFVSDT